MSINSTQLVQILSKINMIMEEKKLYLSELDGAIGDGDHGLNMSKGFKAVEEKIKEEDSSDIGNILKKAGMALVLNVGGASGPLYGTAFMKAATCVNGKSSIDIVDFYNMLYEGLKGIKQRGKSDKGDKTMIDAIEPALEELKKGIESKEDSIKILEKVKESSLKGMENTKNIIAKKGRASYLGERSIGHQDPGATSSFYILNTIYEEVKKISK
ncbi:dihydroxyacetone kinase subunit DhaL [Clostridium rectalis]|uniref:dihydroxyacetone kinase subunit DhaL n=1 Tax=Clostridium rectalis TaxID=2040295 RepID=UPI000F636177|nr:dihydroxyacetone kinase subunit DhaL [Clostridium rectalis]